MHQAPEITENLPIRLNWTKEQRMRYFAMGVCLPIVSFLSASYFAFTSTGVLFRSVITVLGLLCLVSSLGMAACCISPNLGNRRWVQATLKFGVVIWLPLAFCVAFGSGMTALIPSVIIAGLIALVARAIVPLWPSNARFSIRQIFWLTTLAAVLCAGTAAILQAFENAWIIPYTCFWLAFVSTPVMAFVTFAIASAEISAAELKARNLKP
jgi:hypothetical protein